MVLRVRPPHGIATIYALASEPMTRRRFRSSPRRASRCGRVKGTTIRSRGRYRSRAYVFSSAARAESGWVKAGGGKREDQKEAILSDNAEKVKATIAEEGASFIGDIQSITGLTMLAVREAIRELVAWGIVTNDTVEALREIARWKAMVPRTGSDPTSWLPADYAPSPNRRF